MADHIPSPPPLRLRPFGALPGIAAPVGIAPFTEAKVCARYVRSSMERPRSRKNTPRGADGHLRTGAARRFSPKSLDGGEVSTRKAE